MTTITNLTRDAISLPKKGGGDISLRGGEAVSGAFDMESGKVQGYLAAQAIALGKEKAETAPDNKVRATKPE